MPSDVPLAIGCALLLGIAVTLQKKGLGPTFRASLRSPVWRLAVALELVADGLYLAAAGAPRARLVVLQPIVALHFVVAMGAATVLLRERLARSERIASSMLVVGGAIVIAARPDAHGGAIDRSLALALSCGAMFAGVACAAVASRSAKVEALSAIAAGLVFSGSVVATRVAGADLRADAPSLFSAALVVIGNIAGFVLVQLALRRGRAAVVSPVVALVTLVVPLAIGVFALHEPFGAWSIAGSVVVAFGLALLLAKRAP